MRKSVKIALVLGALLLSIGVGCSEKLSSGFSSVPDLSNGGHTQGGPTGAGGGDTTDAGDNPGCEAYLADAEPPDAAGHEPDSSFTASPCQPSGAYDAVVMSSGTCPEFPAATTMETMDYDPMPYPFADCTPPQPIFSADVCTVYFPPGTICQTSIGPMTFQSCGYFNCSKDGGFCVYYIDGIIDRGGGNSCHLIQTIRLTR